MGDAMAALFTYREGDNSPRSFVHTVVARGLGGPDWTAACRRWCSRFSRCQWQRFAAANGRGGSGIGRGHCEKRDPGKP